MKTHFRDNARPEQEPAGFPPAPIVRRGVPPSLLAPDLSPRAFRPRLSLVGIFAFGLAVFLLAFVITVVVIGVLAS